MFKILFDYSLTIYIRIITDHKWWSCLVSNQVILLFLILKQYIMFFIFIAGRYAVNCHAYVKLCKLVFSWLSDWNINVKFHFQKGSEVLIIDDAQQSQTNKVLIQLVFGYLSIYL